MSIGFSASGHVGETEELIHRASTIKGIGLWYWRRGRRIVHKTLFYGGMCNKLERG